MAAEIRKILVRSTAHLTPATLASLNAGTDQSPYSVDPVSYGFLLYAHDERPDGAPDDVWAICVKARELGCDYVKLDCDAETLDGLEAFDHG